MNWHCMRVWLLCGALTCAVVGCDDDRDASHSTGAAIDVTVDPRVELMGVIFRLAGNPEYNKCRVPSYDRDIEAHFGSFRKHPVVKLAARLREERGVSFDAPMTLAVHLTDAEALRPRLPLDPTVATMDSRWQAEDLQQFLEEAREFAKATHFREFFGAHEPLYTETSRRLHESVQRSVHLEWFDDFYGRSSKPKFHVIAGLLNGPCNYGPHFGQGEAEEIYAIRGVWAVDRDGVPLFGDETVIIHEFSHSYVNPVVSGHLRELGASGKRFFESEREQMEKMAYGQWETMMRESVVRACEIRYALKYSGKTAALRRRTEESALGFRWVGPLSDLLGEYEANRERYPDLDSFMPRIAAFLDDYAKSYSPSRPWSRALSYAAWLVLQPSVATILTCAALVVAVIRIKRRRKRTSPHAVECQRS